MEPQHHIAFAYKHHILSMMRSVEQTDRIYRQQGFLKCFWIIRDHQSKDFNIYKPQWLSSIYFLESLNCDIGCTALYKAESVSPHKLSLNTLNLSTESVWLHICCLYIHTLSLCSSQRVLLLLPYPDQLFTTFLSVCGQTLCSDALRVITTVQLFLEV